jgi:hypothetical protein
LRRLPLGEFAVAGAFFLAAFAATSLSRVTEAPDVVWPGNALAAALLVRLPQVRWVAALLAIIVAGTSANWLAVHEPLHYSTAMSVVNALEIGTTAWIFRNWLTFPLPNISFHQGLRMAGVFAFAVPSLTAFPGGLLVHSEFGVPLPEASFDWWLSGAIRLPVQHQDREAADLEALSRREPGTERVLSGCDVFDGSLSALPVHRCGSTADRVGVSRGFLRSRRVIGGVRVAHHRAVEPGSATDRVGWIDTGTAVFRVGGDDSAADRSRTCD